jgi:hypothetical protein
VNYTFAFKYLFYIKVMVYTLTSLQNRNKTGTTTKMAPKVSPINCALQKCSKVKRINYAVHNSMLPKTRVSEMPLPAL